MDIKNFLVFSAFLINLFLSALIYFRSPKSKANITFLATAGGITAWCLAMFFYRSADANSAIIWAKFLYFFPTFIPTAFLLFGLFFPNKKVDTLLVLDIVCFNIFMAFLTLYGTTVIKDVIIIPGEEKKIIFGWAYYWLYILYIPGFFTASYIIFFRKYLQESPFIKMQILYILLGMTAASMPAMITNLNMPTFGNFKFNWVGQLFTVFWIGGVAYAIIKHRLIDIRIVFARSIVYSLLILILSVVYAGGLFVVGTFIFKHPAASGDLFTSTLLALIITFTFQPLRGFLERITNRIFFKGVYDSGMLLGRLSRIMASTAFLSYLAELLLQELTTQMKITFASIVLLRKSSIRWVKNSGNAAQVDYNEEEISRLISWVMKKPGENILVFEEMPESPEKIIMREHNLAIVLPLIVKDEVIGAMLLGEKSSGDIFSSKDIEVLKILAPEAAVAINNALSYEEIKRFNITLEEQVKRATDELRKANGRLEELDHVKDEFVSLASHELRTPMTVIKSYLWMMLDKKSEGLTEKQRMYIERAYNSTQRLINLVNDMLNVSRIESGRLSLTIQDVDVLSLAEKIHAEMLPKAEEQGLTLEIEKKTDIPHVAADPERVEQVLINLVGNALKFTPQSGKVKIILSVKDDKVVIEVQDTGKGIKTDEMQRLFQKFGMLDSDYLKASSVQGTGLGLYISKSLVELQGGTIWVESEGVGKGATFGFSIPIYSPHTETQTEATA